MLEQVKNTHAKDLSEEKMSNILVVTATKCDKIMKELQKEIESDDSTEYGTFNNARMMGCITAFNSLLETVTIFNKMQSMIKLGIVDRIFSAGKDPDELAEEEFDDLTLDIQQFQNRTADINNDLVLVAMFELSKEILDDFEFINLL